MKKFTIKATGMAMALVLGAAAFAGCGAKEEKLDGTKTFADVNGTEIPAGVASFAVRYQQAQTEYYYASMFSSMYGSEDGASSMWSQEYEEGVTFGEQTRDTIIEELEKMYIIRDKAKDLGLEITEEESAAMEKAAKAFIEANDAETLGMIGVTENDVKEYLELSTYYEKAFDPVIADVDIEVTDEEAAQSTITYAFKSTKNVEDDEKEKSYTMMEGLLADVQASENPSAADIITMSEELDDSIIALEYNYSSTPSEDDTMDESLRKAADTLADGEVYDGIVEGEAGYFVVRKDLDYDEEATAEKKESLISSKQQEAFTEIVQGWLDEAEIEVDEDMLELIQITDQESFTMLIPETEEATDETTTGDTAVDDAADDAATEE